MTLSDHSFKITSYLKDKVNQDLMEYMKQAGSCKSYKCYYDESHNLLKDHQAFKNLAYSIILNDKYLPAYNENFSQ